MDDLRGWTQGLLASWIGPLRTPPRQAESIREDETAICLDCHVIFNVRNLTCPKCAGQGFWLIANWKKETRRPAVSQARSVMA